MTRRVPGYCMTWHENCTKDDKSIFFLVKCPTVARTRKYCWLLHPTVAAGACLEHKLNRTRSIVPPARNTALGRQNRTSQWMLPLWVSFMHTATVPLLL
eukprot:17769-Heterococcus_DN1.PRE.1